MLLVILGITAIIASTVLFIIDCIDDIKYNNIKNTFYMQNEINTFTTDVKITAEYLNLTTKEYNNKYRGYKKNNEN